MKAVKIVLTVLITIIFVTVAFATEILALVNITVTNPWFYKTGLKQMGFYEEVRTLMVSQINTFVDQQDAIPEDFIEQAYDITDDAFDKDEFASQVGDLIGGTIEYIVYEKGDPVIPLSIWIENLNQEIDTSGIVEDIVDYEISKGTFTEEERDFYLDSYRSVLRSTYTSYMGMFTSLFGSSSKLSEFIKIMAPTDQIMEKMNSQFWKIRFWVQKSKLFMYIGIGILILLLCSLFFIWRKKVGIVFKIAGIFFIINSAIIILTGVGLLLSITIGTMIDKIPYMLLAYISLIQSVVNPIGVVALGVGIIFMALGIIVTVIGGALVRKKADQVDIMKTNSVPEIKEIDYKNESE